MRFSVVANLLLALGAAQASSIPRQETADVLLRGTVGRAASHSGVGEAPDVVGPPKRQLAVTTNFAPLACNADLTVDDCAPGGPSALSLKELLLAADPAVEALVPCGACAVVDYTDGEVVTIPRGVNVEGMLFFPQTASVELRVPHLFVQGILKIDAPDEGKAIKVHFTDDGGLDQVMVPHADNAGACDAAGCNYQHEAFVVAGGTLDIQALPDPACPAWVQLKAILDYENRVLEVGSEAAACWSRRLGDEVLITDTVHVGVPYKSLTGTIADADVVAGTVTLAAPPADKEGNPSAGYISSLANDPDFPAEVAWLSRSVVFDADVQEVQSCDWCHLHCDKDKTRGGHMIVDHTPGVAQRIEGAEFRNFGQGGVVGRYPIHFHMCSDVAGSVVRKNVVRSSGQRCVVIHQSDNVNIEENVAFGHRGHCYMLEDGLETGNVFRKNLGADGWRHSCVESFLHNKRDNRASTFWISNAHNQYIDNVAAGSINGFWFDMVEGEPINTFVGNTAHSNLVEGIKLYRGGYRPNGVALLEDTKSYRNYQQGVRLHVNKNIHFRGLLLADNGIGISSFDNNGFPDADERCVFENVRVIGLSEKSREMYRLDDLSGEAFVDPYPVITWGVAHESIIDDNHYVVDGVKFTHDPDFAQIVLRNVSFSGFAPHPAPASAAVDEYDILALRLWGAAPGFHNAEGSTLQGGDKRFHDMPVMDGVFMESDVNSFDIEQGYLDFQEKNTWDADVYLQDIDGTMGGEPGVFIVKNPPAKHTFLAENDCYDANQRPNSVALFCPGVCIRIVIAYSACAGDLLLSRPSDEAASRISGTIAFGSTYKHEFFVSYDDYWIDCLDSSGMAVDPKYLHLEFDGVSHSFYSNFGFKGVTVKPPPTCQPYVEESMFDLGDISLHQRYEGEGPISYTDSYNGVQFDADRIRMTQQRDITYGPVNFGGQGETGSISLRYKGLSDGLQLTVKLEDGTIIADRHPLHDGEFHVAAIAIGEEVEGVHELIFTINRYAGTHIMFEMDWFELLPPVEIPLYQRFDAEDPITWDGSYNGVQFDTDIIRMTQNRDVTYGPVNFGGQGETGSINLLYKGLSDGLQLTVKLEDGTIIADRHPLHDGEFQEAAIAIGEEVEGVHELIFTINRYAGTHIMFEMDWFELRPPVEIPLYQRFEAEDPITWDGSYNGVQFDADIIRMTQNRDVTYGPVNFGGPGQTGTIGLRYKGLSDGLRLTVKLEDGTMIADNKPLRQDGFYEATIHIGGEVEGVHELIFTINRYAGTHIMFEMDWFELRPTDNTFKSHIDTTLASSWGNAEWHGDALKLQVNTGWVSFKQVNFGEPGQISVMRVRYSKPSGWGGLAARLGSKDAAKFFDHQLLVTGSWDEFVEVDLPIDVDGVHDLYFTAHRSSGTHKMVAIDSFELLA